MRQTDLERLPVSTGHAWADAHVRLVRLTVARAAHEARELRIHVGLLQRLTGQVEELSPALAKAEALRAEFAVLEVGLDLTDEERAEALSYRRSMKRSERRT